MWCKIPEIWNVTDRIFSCFGQFFALLSLPAPPNPLNNPTNQNFAKIKKIPRGIIILHKRTTNDNHMTYRSWDINCNRQFFLCGKMEKRSLEISFYTSVPKIMIIISYTVSEIWQMTDVIVILHFGLF